MVAVQIHDGAAQRTVLFDLDVVRIGRDPSCDLALPGDTSVSRLHAVLRATPQGWVLTDQGSRNGTILNGVRLDAPATMSPGDRAVIGPFVLVLADGAGEDIETTPGPAGLGASDAATRLSPRELEVLRLVVAGLSDQQIADQLVLSVKTVHTHLDRLRDKTGCRRRPEIVRWALSRGLA